MALLLCGGCSRHIQKSHTTCPFCGATEGHVPGARPLSRATRALLLFSSAVAAAAGPSACSTSDTSPVGDVSTDAAYGGADGPFQPFQDAASDAPFSSDVSTDSVYGAPDAPFFDASDSSADSANDGGND